MDVPAVGPIMGLGAGLVWRGFETWSQISFRNQVRRPALPSRALLLTG